MSSSQKFNTGDLVRILSWSIPEPEYGGGYNDPDFYEIDIIGKIMPIAQEDDSYGNYEYWISFPEDSFLFKEDELELVFVK